MSLLRRMTNIDLNPKTMGEFTKKTSAGATSMSPFLHLIRSLYFLGSSYVTLSPVSIITIVAIVLLLLEEFSHYRRIETVDKEIPHPSSALFTLLCCAWVDDWLHRCPIEARWSDGYFPSS